MKKILPIVALLAICFLLFTSFVKADFDQAYQAYLSQYDRYRTSLTNFLMAKNRYLSYKTLNAQTEALTATKTFLEDRDEVLIVYLKLLLEKNPAARFKNLLEQEINFFSEHKKLIPALASLDDSVQASNGFKEHFSTTEVLIRQTIAHLLILKVQSFDERIAAGEIGFEEKVNSARDQGKDVATLERWLLETKNKQLLAREKVVNAQTLIDKLVPKSSSAEIGEDFRKIQVLIFEANQYLKEATAYLKEIKEELKYGNY